MGHIEDTYSTPWELLGVGGSRADAEMRVVDPWYRLRMERTLGLVRFPLGDAMDVLDLGCGVGLYDFTLVRRWPSARVAGVDINPQQVDFANNRARELGLSARLGFLCADVRSFDPHHTYDVVLLTDIVEHLKDPSNCLVMARKAVRTGGRVIVSVPITPHPRKDWWFWRQVPPDDAPAIAGVSEGPDSRSVLVRYWHKKYTIGELVSLLHGSGFDLKRRVLCRFDLQYLRKRCSARLWPLLDLVGDGERALKPAVDRMACAAMPHWAKTCIVVAAKR